MSLVYAHGMVRLKQATESRRKRQAHRGIAVHRGHRRWRDSKMSERMYNFALRGNYLGCCLIRQTERRIGPGMLH